MKKIIIILVLIPLYVLAQSNDRVIVKSVLENNRLILLTSSKLDQSNYSIFINRREVGTIKVLTGKRAQQFDQYRFEYTVEADNEFFKQASAGVTILLKASAQKKLPVYEDAFTKEVIKYKPVILSQIDKRSMVFVQGGVTLVGSDVGTEDEKPLHKVIVNSIYVDKFEVSNRDFLYFVQKQGLKPPHAWINGEFPQKLANYPVLVTYYEADAYARWAGKRLPTEYEWERAANGVVASQKIVTPDGVVETPFKTLFPWGNQLHTDVNFVELWLNNDSDFIKKYTKGFLPVDFFINRNISYYGAVNMSGNAAEWTSSWYRAYPGSSYNTIRFGKQVKVVRGGDYQSPMSEITTSARSYGGIPSLESDNRIGFRCVKDVDKNDEVIGSR